VAIGIVVELTIHISRGLKLRNTFSMAYQLRQTAPGTYHIAVSGAAVFSNIITLKSLLADFPEGKTVFFDLSDTDLIDHTVMEFIHHFTEDYNHAGGHCEIVGLDKHESYSNHQLSAKRRIAF